MLPTSGYLLFKFLFCKKHCDKNYWKCCSKALYNPQHTPRQSLCSQWIVMGYTRGPGRLKISSTWTQISSALSTQQFFTTVVSVLRTGCFGSQVTLITTKLAWSPGKVDDEVLISFSFPQGWCTPQRRWRIKTVLHLITSHPARFCWQVRVSFPYF